MGGVSLTAPGRQSQERPQTQVQPGWGLGYSPSGRTTESRPACPELPWSPHQTGKAFPLHSVGAAASDQSQSWKAGDRQGRKHPGPLLLCPRAQASPSQRKLQLELRIDVDPAYEVTFGTLELRKIPWLTRWGSRVVVSGWSWILTHRSLETGFGVWATPFPFFPSQ